MSSKRQDFRRFCRPFFFRVKNTLKKFKKIQKIFPKPLDKSKNYAIIRVQKERNKQKMFQIIKIKRENRCKGKDSREREKRQRVAGTRRKRSEKEGTKSDDSCSRRGESLKEEFEEGFKTETKRDLTKSRTVDGYKSKGNAIERAREPRRFDGIKAGNRKSRPPRGNGGKNKNGEVRTEMICTSDTPTG